MDTTPTRYAPLEWFLPVGSELATLGSALATTLSELAEQHFPDLGDLFPFSKRWEIQGHFRRDWFVIRLTNRPGAGVPVVGQLGDEEVAAVQSRLIPLRSREYENLRSLLGDEWYSPAVFSYVGRVEASRVSWQELYRHLVGWANDLAIPDVLERNRARVLRAIPTPPRWDIERVSAALWVLESRNEPFRQGTAFALDGIGIVTCHHVLTDSTVALDPHEPGKEHSVRVLRSEEAIDLAVIELDVEPAGGLPLGSADDLNHMDHVAIAGFPNYRLGDTANVSPGLVTGFRPVSGIRRILVNAPIVAGASGGPMLDRANRVVAVAVTGADRMEDAHLTENHGGIPIDAIRLLK